MRYSRYDEYRYPRFSRSQPGDFTVTLREVIFSVLIVGILFGIGFLISSAINDSINEDLLKYRQAIQLSNPTEFAYSMKTDVGHAFIEGRFKTIDPVTDEKLGGKHLSIRAVYQKYTMHTRVVHYTTGSGKHRHHHTRIEHYWTWDTYDVRKKHANRVNFCGSEFKYGAFSYSHVGERSKTVNNGYHLRIVFDYRPTDFLASAFSNLRDGTVSGGTALHEGMTTKRLYEICTTSHGVAMFWVGWSIFIAFAVFGFIYIDNTWLED